MQEKAIYLSSILPSLENADRSKDITLNIMWNVYF